MHHKQERKMDRKRQSNNTGYLVSFLFALKGWGGVKVQASSLLLQLCTTKTRIRTWTQDKKDNEKAEEQGLLGRPAYIAHQSKIVLACHRRRATSACWRSLNKKVETGLERVQSEEKWQQFWKSMRKCCQARKETLQLTTSWENVETVDGWIR